MQVATATRHSDQQGGGLRVRCHESFGAADRGGFAALTATGFAVRSLRFSSLGSFAESAPETELSMAEVSLSRGREVGGVLVSISVGVESRFFSLANPLEEVCCIWTWLLWPSRDGLWFV